MLITRFQVKGFRSLEDVVVDGLGPLNVFYGENGVGKSNLLKAFELFGRVIGDGAKPSTRPNDSGGRSDHFATPKPHQLGVAHGDYSWGGSRRIELSATIEASIDEIPEPATIRVTIDRSQKPPIERDWGQLTDAAISYVHSSFYNGGIFRVPSRRRLERESFEPSGGTTVDSLGSNLKRMLFWASVSPQRVIKARFWDRLVPILKEAPLALGEPSPVGSSTSDVDVHFHHEGRDVSVGDLGSGVQQILLMSGLICLSDARIVALEEPEMNLSWSRQRDLVSVLRKLVGYSEHPPNQLFISSHSPLFASEQYFDVTSGEKGTQVERRPRGELPYFDGVDLPENTDERGARLMWRNLVRLPEHVVADLDLKPGQLVFFRRTEGTFALMSEAEFEQYMLGEDAEGE